MKNNLPIRKNTRLPEFDYCAEGVYFITICTQDRKNLLSDVSTPQISKIVGDGVLDVPQKEDHSYLEAALLLSSMGKVAENVLIRLNDFYENISIDNYVIMPNHIHLLLWVKPKCNENGRSGTPAPTKPYNSMVSQFVSTFKRFCNKEYGCNIWQRGFYDHIIRNTSDYEKHVEYICNNPVCWEFDKLYSDE